MADRSLEILFEAERKGYEGKPSTFVRLTLESYGGNRYLLYGQYNPGASKATSQVSVRGAELPAFYQAIKSACEKWEVPDQNFTGELSHADYAKTLDWG